MKKLITFSLLVIGLINLNAQIPSSCIIPSELKSSYDKDVKHLALQRIISQDSPYMDSIDIPFSYQDTIWSGLAAIFNVSSIPERDSAFDIYCIHEESTNNTIYNYIEVGVDLSYDWTHNWQNYNIVTGIPSLDTLLLTYGFSVYDFTSVLGYHYAILSTDQTINIQPVCDSIKTYSGVTYSIKVSYTFDGNTISYNKTGDERTYQFEIAWGDCPSGCICYHTYNFKVYDNCSVEYLGTSHYNIGYPFPLPVNCNITTKVENNNFPVQFKAYPNPAQGFINIDANYNNIEFEIINIFGQIIKTGTLSNHIISLENIDKGLYILALYPENDNAIEFIKIIKQ
ncbi:MAG: T9SS type A sorting domain-containing protein [Chlorobi bacterium]|nr:T9SS type A sorting domain-containing protein [Chlorobiota bacterium]